LKLIAVGGQRDVRTGGEADVSFNPFRLLTISPGATLSAVTAPAASAAP